MKHWLFSEAFDAPDNGVINELPESIFKGAWTSAKISDIGIVEFLRFRQIPNESKHWAVAAKVVVNSSTQQNCAMTFGYSDEISLKVNDQLHLYQNAAYRYAVNRQEGLFHPEQLIAYLPLKKGKNEIQAIIADRFGGWGFIARLVDCEGAKLSMPM